MTRRLLAGWSAALALSACADQPPPRTSVPSPPAAAPEKSDRGGVHVDAPGVKVDVDTDRGPERRKVDVDVNVRPKR